MTACTNHGGKARRVVTAALVGVLSVGTVPMAALATGVSDAISPLFAEGGIDGTDFSAGEATPTLTQDSNGDGIFGGAADQSIVPQKNEDGVWEVAATGEAIKVDVDMIVVPSGDPVNIDSSNVRDYKVRVYKADEDGNPTGGALSGNKIVDAGEYVITVTALTGSPYAGQTFKTNIVVKGQDLPTGIVAFENGEKADMDFTFTGSALDIDFKYDPDTTDASSSPWAVLDEGTEYTVTYKKNGQTVDSVTDAGTYVATLTGKGKYAGSQADVTIVVDKFVIDSNATVEIAPFEESAGDHPVSVSRTDDDGFTVELDPVLVSIAPQTSTSAPGPYTFDLTTSDSANVSIVSGTTATGRKVENLATFTYKNEALADAYELDHSKGEEFDTSDIEAFNGKTEITTGVNVDVDLVKAADEDGEDWAYTGNDEDDLNAGLPGIYRVVVKVEDTASSKYAGTAVFTVTVYKGSLDADASVYVYGPETSSTTPVAITEYAKGYDGEVLSTASFGVVSKGVKLSDLEKKLVDSDGNEVEEAVNAGSYKLVVTSDWYKLSGTTELPITIGKVDLNSMRVGALKKWNTVAGESVLFLPVGGIDCTTVSGTIDGLDLVYATGVDGAAIDETGYNKDDFKGEDEVPDVVDTLVEYDDNGTWKEVGEIDQSGRYRVTVTVAEDIAGNFAASTKTLEFTVASAGAFKDVQPSAWYYDVVQKAFDNGYMNGTTAPTDVNGKPADGLAAVVTPGVFAPEATLTRGQVACVLFNASGADVDETGGAWNEHTGWDTGFSDVDGTQFYGEAVYWAKQNGVINGYADGTFRADKPVTREEFLSMLANYAEVVLGDDTVGTVSTDVLAEFPDGSSVSGWAAVNVAWAAEKGIAGNGGTLMPADVMTRAYCAAMMVNYLDPTA